MRCAECKREIADGSQVCPVCRTPVSLPYFAAPASPAGLPSDAVGWHQPNPTAGQEIPAWEGLAARKSRRPAPAIAGAAIAAALAVILGVALTHTSSARRPSAGTQQLTEPQLRPGDCLVGKDLGLGTNSPWPYTVTAVPCTQRHLAEIFFAGYPWPESLTKYPGDNAVFNMEDQRCRAAFTAYVGIDPSLSIFLVDETGPSIASDWATGDREVVCIASESGTPLRRSIKGARR